MNREDLVRSLIQYAASGKLDPRQVQPVLGKLLGEPSASASTGEVLEALVDLQDPSASALVDRLREARRKDALSFHGLKVRGQAIPEDLRASLNDLPLEARAGWTTRENALPRVQALLRLLGDRFFFSTHRQKAPGLEVTIEKKQQETMDAAFRDAPAWETPSLLDMIAEVERQSVAGRLDVSRILPPLKQSVDRKRQLAVDAAEGALARPGQPLPPDLDAEVFLARLSAQYAQSQSREERRRLLDLACLWPTDAAAPFLLDLAREPWAQDRASLILTLRFGQPSHATWDAWKTWLQGQINGKGVAGDGSRLLARKRPMAMLYLWYSHQADADRDALGALEQLVSARIEPVTMNDFVERWAASISADEWKALTGAVAPVVVVEEAPAPKVVASWPPVAAPAPAQPRTVPPRPPPRPSVWDVHLKPFFLENWYMVAGVAMVLVGSSLLAYYTWNKGWLIRYTIMPSLLGAFTAALAWMGGWIERKDAGFKGTAAVLRGAAIGLLPINFMAVALLANDQDVTHKALAVPLMGAVYLALAGWGLRHWCAAVHPALGWTLGGTLLFQNALVMLAGAKSGLAPHQLLPVVGAGFYLGFFALAAAVVRFARTIVTAELAKEKRVVWFFGAALSVTFLQVFAWVHSYLAHLPGVHLYAPMVVLTGWLVLFMERRTLELRGEGEKHGAESFLGFALILLGALMGMGDPILRIVSLVLAGTVWIYQSVPRRQPVHHWIGLTFVTLGGASVGLLEGFPAAWWPALGIGLAVALGGFALLSRSNEALSRAAGGMQAAVLILSVLVTVLGQFHSKSDPRLAAGQLGAISLLFGVRAWRDGKIRWVQTAMVILALTLPYLAGMDLANNVLHSTTLVFGLAVLSLLWIGLTLVVRSPLLQGARSTVLWTYGVLALACMALRGTIDPLASADAAWLDLGGPLLMTGVLVWAGYFSRSLVPAGMAMLIGLVLTPELKGRMQEAYPDLGWGSGLGSALTALGLAIGALVLRRLSALRDLGDGDKYMGEIAYPLRRTDHTLFTLPMIASAIFLAVKVETWNLALNMGPDGPSLRMSIALLVSGAAWTLFAVYLRSSRMVQAASYFGLFWMIVGVSVGLRHVAPRADAATTALVPGLFVQALFFAYRFLLERRYPWVADLLTSPTRIMLRLGSVLIAAVCTLVLLFDRTPAPSLGALTAFAALQLAWHGLASRRLFFGAVLFVLDLASLATWGGKGGFVVSALGLVIAVQVAQAVLEFKKPFYEFLRPLMVPFQAGATLLAFCLSLLALRLSIEDSGFSPLQLALTVIALLLSARANSSGALALLAVLVGYVLLDSRVLSTDQRIAHLVHPVRLSFLAFTMAVLGHAGRRIHRVHPVVLSGGYAPAMWPAFPWMALPAALLACVASFYHTADPALRGAPANVWAPYVSAATFGVLAFSTGLLPVYHAAGAFLTLGNVHLIRVCFGEFLRGHGLSEVHLVALGIAFTLLQGSAVRILLRKEEITRLVRQASLVWAGLVLLLISANYLVHPNLATIQPLRFAISGGMAFLAGWYFRRAARHPAPGEEPFAAGCEGLYHFGVTMALWCAALMVPVLRHPITALVALGLPVLYFYARAESGYRREGETFARYRRSAATLAFIVLALYSFRGFVQMTIFPDTAFNPSYYHANSPVIFVLGLVLLRLHGLGGTTWSAFYGGLAVMAGTYFALTALPGLSPFTRPVAAAWCAIGLAHFYTLASLQHSPIRTAIQRLAAVDAQGWQALRRPWGLCLLVASHAMALWGILHHGAQPKMVAPLILGAASVLVHQGILRGSRIYPLLAQLEVAIALHVGFLGIPSFLAPDRVVWALLGLWAAMLAAQPVIQRLGGRWEMGGHAAILAALTAGHVFYHHPSSPAGLWAFGLGAILVALTPRKSRVPETAGEVAAAVALPWVPAWIVWFSQAPLRTEGVAGALHAWPALATAATLLATGALASLFQKGWAAGYVRTARLQPRLFDHAVSWLGVAGGATWTAMLWATFLVTALVQATHWGKPFAARELILLEGLYAGFAVAWLFDGRARKSAASYFLMEVCLLAAFVAGREQLQLTRGLWKHEYDVWASLAAFFALVGAKQVLENQPREVLVPLRSTLLALPVFSLTWIGMHHLGTELGLLTVGLHSAAFAYLGRDDRESPYHLVAIAGFTAFVLLLFWSRLHLRMVYAYVVPVGLGVLVLLQLFRRRVPPEVRNGVRAVTVLAMLGSAGWSALVGSTIPVLHNVALAGLCLAAMALGGFLRIRMYVALGFGALMVDLLALIVKMVALMERSAQMTIVGSMVLVVGAALVFGAIYYKTHRKEIAELLERWRLRFAGWE